MLSNSLNSEQATSFNYESKFGKSVQSSLKIVCLFRVLATYSTNQVSDEIPSQDNDAGIHYGNEETRSLPVISIKYQSSE